MVTTRGGQASSSQSEETTSGKTKRQRSPRYRHVGREVSKAGPAISYEDLDKLEYGYRRVARAGSPDARPGVGEVEDRRIKPDGRVSYKYLRYLNEDDIYPVFYPRDEHLYNYISEVKFGNPPCKVPSQARLLENAILTGRDVLEGTVTSSERMFFPGVERKWEFPSGVNDFNLIDNRLTRAPFYTPALWGHSDGQIRREQDRAGLFLAPCKWGYHAEPLVLDCLAMRFRMGAAAGWYNDLNLRSPHTFRPGGVEFTDYVLEHYMPLLERVDLYHSVYAAKFHYPIFQGICCGLMEVFLKE